MPKIIVTPFAASDYLDSEETIEAYLEFCRKEHDPELLRHALANVELARVRLAKGAAQTPDTP